MLIFGMGYTAGRLADHLRSAGWQVTGTRREPINAAIAFHDKPAVPKALPDAQHRFSPGPPPRY